MPVPIAFALKRRRNSRHIRIAVHADGSVAVTAPLRAAPEAIERAVANQAAWIAKAQDKCRQKAAGLVLAKPEVDKREFLTEAKAAVEKWAVRLGARPAKVSVRRMRSRWGSCSRSGNISLNIQLGHLPQELLEYVAVHELAHLREHNHSPRFWAIVAAHLPDFKARKKLLNRYGFLLRK